MPAGIALRRPGVLQAFGLMTLMASSMFRTEGNMDGLETLRDILTRGTAYWIYSKRKLLICRWA